jgi:hypothetical protein
MAGKITELAASLRGTAAMLFEVVQGGVNLKLTGAQLKAYTGPDHPGYVAGNWYISQSGGLASGTVVADAGKTWLAPFFIKERCTLSDLGTRVSTAVAASLFGLAIYASDPVTKMPTGAALGSVTGLSSAAVGIVTGAMGANITLDPGMYWSALQKNDTGTAFLCLSTNAGYMSNWIGASTSAALLTAGTTGIVTLEVAVGYATGFPDMTAQAFSVTQISQDGNALIFKVFSVP